MKKNLRHNLTKSLAIAQVVLAVLTMPGIVDFALGNAPSIAPEALAATSNFNKQINYQGKLTTPANVAVADGSYYMTFRLYTTLTSATTTNIWEEIHQVAGDKIQVTNGLFSVMLGSTTALTGVNFNQTLYLGVEIGGAGGSPSWDGEMSPRKILGTV